MRLIYTKEKPLVLNHYSALFGLKILEFHANGQRKMVFMLIKKREEHLKYVARIKVTNEKSKALWTVKNIFMT